jgi:hypothetical protein
MKKGGLTREVAPLLGDDLTKISYTWPLEVAPLVGDDLTKISYTWPLNKVRFLHDSGLYSVRLRQISL